MTDPKRWTESDSDSTEIERELVTAGQRANLPPELKQEMWSALVHSALPLAPPIQASTEGGSSATAASSLSHQLSTAKLVLGLAALGAASSGGYWVLNRSSRATVTLPSAPPARTDASAAPAPSASPKPEEVGSETSALANVDAGAAAALNGAPGSSGLAQSPRTLLREESQAVLEIRRVLRAGDAATALRLLERARARFSHPVLGQEREALTIEALARSGARDVAARRAATFLRDYPKSPHAADVRAFTAR